MIERVNLYDRIAVNKRNSWLVMAGFALFVLLLGWAFGLASGWGSAGILVAAVIAVVLAYLAYFKSDSVAVAASGAVPASERDFKQLHDVVEGLAIAAGISKPRVFIIPGGGINAFAAGRDPQHAVVAVTEGALKKLSRSELEGVLAHELSHVRNYDVRFMTTVMVMVGVVALLSDWLLYTFFWGGGRRDREGGAWVFALSIVLAVLAPVFANIVAAAASRKREFLADADGALLCRNPAGLAGALRKIKGESDGGKDAGAGRGEDGYGGVNSAMAPLYFFNPLSARALFASHPPIEERIKYLESLG
ncbi:MAG: M48 family metalloprotease [Candidatus Micrarchaeota archaeon]